MSISKFDVTVLLMTYNHETYIQAALDSVFGQVYNGRVELIVADDKSTDRTLEIIRENEGRDPRFTFKYLERPQNVGITTNYKQAFAAASADFVAVIEGDDLWSNRTKLGKQLAVLVERGECVMCGCNYYTYEEDKSKFTSRTSIDPVGVMFMDSRYLIQNNLPGNFSACVYRRSALMHLPEELFRLKAYDWAVNICIGRYGMLAYLHEPLSIYRLHAGGAWTGLKLHEKLQSQINAIDDYDLLTEGHFSDEFAAQKHFLHSQMTQIAMTPSTGTLKLARKVKRLIYCCTPPLLLLLVKALVPPAILSIARKI